MKKAGGIIIAILVVMGIAGAGSHSSSTSASKTTQQSPSSYSSLNDTTKTEQTKTETPTTPTPTKTEPSSTLSNDNYYTNSAGNTVHSPAYSNSVPEGATAQCSDGTYSFSQSRRGTCSHHGGVASWL